MEKTSLYYDLEKDLSSFPDALIYTVIGGRSTGKTYSTLKYVYENNYPFIYIKRTNDDVKFLCKGSGGTIGAKAKKESTTKIDISPFKPINRDCGYNVKAFYIDKGFGAFWNCSDNGEPVDNPVGYILSLHAIKDIKGFDLSECCYIIFDEFIPLVYERVDRNEGLSLMDLYRTIGRDGYIKGRTLKMILLANSTDISCPVLNELEIVDTISMMQSCEKSIEYIESRYILIHRLNDNDRYMMEESKNPIYKTMYGTQWAEMSLENKFAYNDFSNVRKLSIKGMVPVVSIIHKRKQYYIYRKESTGIYYMCMSKSNRCEVYDLERDNDHKRFHSDYIWILQEKCVRGKMVFQSYTMYDLIVNYKKFYKI